MPSQDEPPLEFIQRVIRVAYSDQLTFLAASIAFYAFLSVFPTMLLILVLGSLLGGEEFAALLVSMIQEVLTPEAEAIVTTALVEGQAIGSASAIGLLVLIWSALKIFRGLEVAFGMIYGQPGGRSFLSTIAYALLVSGAIGVGLLAIVALKTIVWFVPIAPNLARMSGVAVFVTIAIVFFPLYYLLPLTSQRPAEVLPGTVFASIGWSVLTELFGLYAANADTYALFGLIGGVLLLLMWFYFGAIIILAGAVINAVLAGREPSITE